MHLKEIVRYDLMENMGGTGGGEKGRSGEVLLNKLVCYDLPEGRREEGRREEEWRRGGSEVLQK